MRGLLHSRALLPLIPPTPFSHKGRRGSLGFLKPRMREGMQGLPKKPTSVSAIALAAGPGADALRPCVALPPCPRCRSGRSAAAPLRCPLPLASSPRAARLIPSRLVLPRLAPLPKPSRSDGAPRRGHTRQCECTCRHPPPRCRPTFNVQRATFNPSRLIPSRLIPSRLIPSRRSPHPLSPHPPSPRPSPQTLEVGRSPPARAYTPVRVHMSAPTSTLSSHVQRATCNLQPLAPHPLAPHPLAPLASSPLASSPLASSSLASPLSPNPRGQTEPPGAGIHASASAHVGTHLHVVVPRSTCNVQPSTPRASSPRASSPRAARLIPSRLVLPRLAPLPKPSRSGGVPRRGHTRQCECTCRHPPPRCRPTFNVQRATFNPSRLIPSRLIPSRRSPHPLSPRPLSPHPPSPRPSPQTLEVRRSPPARAYTPVRTHMSVHPSTLSSHLQRATFNLSTLSSHLQRATFNLSTLSSHLQRATFNLSTLSSHLQRATFNLSTLSSHLQRATFNLSTLSSHLQRATFNLSTLSSHLQRATFNLSTLSSHLQRATFNLQP
jgi:hypothetical protein